MFASLCMKAWNPSPEPNLAYFAARPENDNAWQGLSLPLSLPESQVAALHDIAERMSHRRCGTQSSIVVVFTGCDAAGKLMAAEALAYEIQHPLHRVDGNEILGLSTEEALEQLARTMRMAREERSILMVDTTEGLPDTLMQMVESYPGLSILAVDSARTTAMRPASAYYTVDFPFPFDSE